MSGDEDPSATSVVSRFSDVRAGGDDDSWQSAARWAKAAISDVDMATKWKDGSLVSPQNLSTPSVLARSHHASPDDERGAAPKLCGDGAAACAATFAAAAFAPTCAFTAHDRAQRGQLTPSLGQGKVKAHG